MTLKYLKFLEEERISIAFLIGDHPSNWPLTEMTGLMEILGLEEYFKTKVTLSLTYIGNGSQLKNPDISCDIFTFS